MGSPLSPLLSEIFMTFLEENIFTFDNPNIKYVFHWARYVDDIFFIWTGTDRQLHMLSLIHI